MLKRSHDPGLFHHLAGLCNISRFFNFFDCPLLVQVAVDRKIDLASHPAVVD